VIICSFDKIEYVHTCVYAIRQELFAQMVLTLRSLAGEIACIWDVEEEITTKHWWQKGGVHNRLRDFYELEGGYGSHLFLLTGNSEVPYTLATAPFSQENEFTVTVITTDKAECVYEAHENSLRTLNLKQCWYCNVIEPATTATCTQCGKSFE
jgi:hypothetical protein